MPIDYKKYPENWLSEIRPRILQRAKNECECCGLPNRSFVYSVKVDSTTLWISRLSDALRVKKLDKLFGNEHLVRRVKVILTIAHLDHDETNMEVSDDRLKAMCQLCHLRYDSEEKKKRRNNGKLQKGQ